MTRHLPVIVVTGLVCGLLGSLGCAPTRVSQQFGFSFLPATPGAPRPGPVSADLSDPPGLAPSFYVNAAPRVFPPPALPGRPSVVDERIRRAEDRFQVGKRLYLDGDRDGARREFDRAIDTLLSLPDAGADRLKLERKLDDLSTLIYRYDIDGLGSGLSDRPGFDRTPLEDILEMTFPVDPLTKGKVKEMVAATVSQLPLEVNDTVLGYISYFSTERGHRTLVSGLRRAGRYKAMISRILAEEGVPQELIFLAQAESGFYPRAVSRAAAAGMWQFIASRGEQYGLRRTGFSDERLDPEKATRAAARHLKDLYTEFGDWYLAMAGYNCGPGGVERAVQRTGYADFFELRARHVLPHETTAYVPIILAMTIMTKNPKAYDLENIEPEQPLEFDTVPVNAATNLNLAADAADCPVSLLQELNPSLLGDIAPTGLDLRVPKGAGSQVIAAIDQVPSNQRVSWRIHRVTTGDTLESIAMRYRSNAGLIMAQNPGATGHLESGAMLLVPVTAEPVRSARAKAAARSKHGRYSVAKHKAGASGKSASRYAGASRGHKSGSAGRSSTSSRPRPRSGRVRVASLR
jgi:membrane-bound lytic murein transglycosylase D